MPTQSLQAQGQLKLNWPSRIPSKRRTILDEDIQALFHRQGGIEYDESETEGKDIIACADLEEVADGALDRRKTKFELALTLAGL